MSRAPALVLALMFGLVGLVFLGTGVQDVLARRRFVARAARGEGTVARVEKASRLNELQVVTFTAQGREVEFRATPARIPSRVGDRVPVLYDPEDPRRAEIDRYEELWHEALLRVGIGAALALLAGGLLTGLRRRPRSP